MRGISAQPEDIINYLFHTVLLWAIKIVTMNLFAIYYYLPIL